MQSVELTTNCWLNDADRRQFSLFMASKMCFFSSDFENLHKVTKLFESIANLFNTLLNMIFELIIINFCLVQMKYVNILWINRTEKHFKIALFRSNCDARLKRKKKLFCAVDPSNRIYQQPINSLLIPGITDIYGHSYKSRLVICCDIFFFLK